MVSLIEYFLVDLVLVSEQAHLFAISSEYFGGGAMI